MNIAFYTLGCKVNQYETQVMREAFESKGHKTVPTTTPFDALVINSCTVTAESDRKTRQILNRFRISCKPTFYLPRFFFFFIYILYIIYFLLSTVF